MNDVIRNMDEFYQRYLPEEWKKIQRERRWKDMEKADRKIVKKSVRRP